MACYPRPGVGVQVASRVADRPVAPKRSRNDLLWFWLEPTQHGPGEVQLQRIR